MLSSTSTCLHCGTLNQITGQNCLACGALVTIMPQFPGTIPTQHWEPVLDPNMSLPGIKSFGADSALSSTLKLFTKNLGIITKIVFLIVAPFELLKFTTLSQVTDESANTILNYGLSAFCNALIAPALFYALMKKLQTGTTPSVQEAFRWATGKLPKLLVCAAIAWILQGLGYMICIVPGIIISLTLAVLYPAAALEKGSISDAFRQSTDLTRGSKMEILGTQIVIGIVVLIVSFPVMLLIESVNNGAITVIGNIGVDVAEQLLTVLSFVMYLGLSRVQKQTHSLLSLNI